MDSRSARVTTMISLSERISVFMDGENGRLPNCAVRVPRSKKESLVWSDFHVIRAALKGELPEVVNLDLWKRVHETLQQDLSELSDEEYGDLLDYKPAYGWKQYSMVSAAFVSVLLVLALL